MLNSFRVVCCLCLFLLLCGCCLSPYSREPVEFTGQDNSEYVSEISFPEAKSNFAYGQYRLFAAEGRWADALEALERAVAFDPDSRYLQMSLAKAYLHVKQQGRSVEILRELLLKHSDYAEGHQLLGDLLLSQGQPEEATTHYRQALELTGKMDSLRLKLAMSLARQGDLTAAIDETRNLLEDSPDFTSARLALARFYKDNRQFSKAGDIYRDLLERKPKQMQILLELGQLLEEQKLVDEALELYQRGLEEDPGSVAVLDQMARLLIAENRYPEALQLLQDLNDQHPNRIQVLGRIGLLQLEMERWAEAELTFRKILRLEPGHQRSHYYLGMALSGSGDLDSALRELGQVSPETDIYLDALTQRAFLYQQAGQPLKAIELLEGELEKGRNEPILYYYLSSAYFSLKQWLPAEEALLAGVEQHPENVNLRYQLGMVYEKQERREEASEEMLQILDIDPDHADALNYLAYIKAEKGEDLEQALVQAERALSIRQASYIMDTLGWIYYKMGRYEESRRYLEEAYQSHVDDPVVLEHLGDLYAAMQLWAKAAEVYRQLLELDPFVEGVREKLEALPEGAGQ